MHPVLRRFARQTVVGVVAIAVGVPLLQGQSLGLTSQQEPQLQISGDVTGLSVARPGTLRLTVTNPGDQDAVVRRLEAAPREQVPGCRLTVEPFEGPLVVPADGTAAATLTVRIAGARCVGARWDLDYASS